jgi:uncharacterized membrane protein YkgB
MNIRLEKFDDKVIKVLKKYSDEISRVALFIIFVWFGFLKTIGLSPISGLVLDLLDKTFLRGLSPDLFLIGFGCFEVLIGILVLFPKVERITFLLLGFHIITTVMPLFLLTEVTWYAPFVPTLVGQYIIKNLALISIGLLLFARLKPMTKTHSILGEEE